MLQPPRSHWSFPLWLRAPEMSNTETMRRQRRSSPRALSDLTIAIPGLTASVIGLVSPFAAWQALAILSLGSPNVKEILDVPLARAVINQFFQFSVTFTTTLILLVTCFVYLVSSQEIKGKFKHFLIAIFICCAVVLFVLFISGGAAWVPLHIEAGQFKMPGIFKMLPPCNQPMTWIRVLLIVLGIILAFWAPRQALAVEPRGKCAQGEEQVPSPPDNKHPQA